MSAPNVLGPPGSPPDKPVAVDDAEPSRPRPRSLVDPWSVRVRDWLSAYLPLLLMLLLAAATWWLVRITPLPSTARANEPSPQAPDYILQGVELVRYRSDGSMMARLRTRELRHYPVGDRMELDEAVIVADHPSGAVRAQARRALVTEEGRRLRLEGDVVLNREATADAPAFTVRSAVLEMDLDAGHAWTTEPVQWQQEGLTVDAAGGFDYRQEPGALALKGPVRARMSTTGARRR